MEQVFIKRAIEIVTEIIKAKTLEEKDRKSGVLEGYLTGALEVFALMDKMPKE